MDMDMMLDEVVLQYLDWLNSSRSVSSIQYINMPRQNGRLLTTDLIASALTSSPKSEMASRDVIIPNLDIDDVD